MILILINGAIISPFVHLAILAQGVASGNPPHIFLYIAPLVAIEFIGMAAWYGHTKQFYDGAKWSHFFLLPLGCVIFTAIYLRSAYLVLSGNKVSWKGRQYRVNSHKTIEPQPVEATAELPVESMTLFEATSKELATK